MRKISKSRTEDDVVSSTNGSVLNEDQTEAGQANDDEKEAVSEADDSLDLNYPDVSKDTKKNKASKRAKGRKRKSDKGDKSEVSEEENEHEKSKGKKRKSEKEDKGDVSEEEYEVEKVIDSKKIKGKLHYLIRWKGYSANSDTWEPENTLSCPELINKFIDEKENAKNKESNTPAKKSKTRKGAAKKKTKEQLPAKKTKTKWDSENADSNAEYEVGRILEVHYVKNGKREFLIHWKGWSSEFDSWEPESNLNCPELIKKFMEKVDEARSVDSRNLRVAPETTNRFTLQDPSSGRRLSKRRGQRQRVRYDDAE